MKMDSSQIKIDLFRKLDSLRGRNLEEAYGMLLNFINGKTQIDDWQNLSSEQKDALNLGIEQLDKGQGRNHGSVMTDIRKRFLND
jgi:hypothetical protein